MSHRFSLRLSSTNSRELRQRLRVGDDAARARLNGEGGDGECVDGGLGCGHIDPTLLVNDASLACVMFLESEVHTNDRVAGRGGRLTNETSVTSRVFAVVIDALVRIFQPPPRMLHAELLLVSSSGECYHFATYIGDEARWRDRGAEYYRIHRWRAIPIDGGDGVSCLASQCDAEVGTPYSISRYALSTSIMGWMSRMVRSRTRDPAHCGGLTARIVQTALGERGAALLPRPSTRYSPSDLYNDLRAHSNLMDFDSADSLLKDVESTTAADVLLSGTDVQVRQLGARRRAEALKTLAVRMNNLLSNQTPEADAQATHHARVLGWAATRVADSFSGGRADESDGGGPMGGAGEKGDLHRLGQGDTVGTAAVGAEAEVTGEAVQVAGRSGQVWGSGSASETDESQPFRL